jgi:hypothetical protein
MRHNQKPEFRSQNALCEAPAVTGIGIHREASLEILAYAFRLLKKERGVPPQTNTALFKWP